MVALLNETAQQPIAGTALGAAAEPERWAVTMESELLLKVTLDTNVLPADDLMAIAAARRIDVAVVTVSEREVRGTKFAVLKPMTAVPEIGVWDESEWDNFVWDADETEAQPGLEDILRVLSNGSFPSVDAREALTVGQRRQLRDAMILEAHVLESRDVFVSEDRRAFIDHGRRESLERITRTRIVTKAELLALLDP